MKNIQYAILVAQALSYGLIITFIFADASFNLSGILNGDEVAITFKSAHIAASLIGIVGAASIWLTWQYMQRANEIRNFLTICAWTHQIKTTDGWVSLETFLTQKLGYDLSHGISDKTFQILLNEAKQGLPKERPKITEGQSSKPPMGIYPKDHSESEKPSDSDQAMKPIAQEASDPPSRKACQDIQAG